MLEWYKIANITVHGRLWNTDIDMGICSSLCETFKSEGALQYYEICQGFSDKVLGIKVYKHVIPDLK